MYFFFLYLHVAFSKCLEFWEVLPSVKSYTDAVISVSHSGYISLSFEGHDTGKYPKQLMCMH